MNVPQTCNRFHFVPDHSAPLEDLFHGWVREFARLLFVSQVGAPRLLELCPDVDARVLLWGPLYRAYGCGRFAKTSAFELSVFLQALASRIGRRWTPEWAVHRQDPDCLQSLTAVEAAGFTELLSNWFLGPALVRSSLFGEAEQHLRAQRGFLVQELVYFESGARWAARDVEVFRSVLERYAATAPWHEAACS
jgi:hypothetical protein